MAGFDGVSVPFKLDGIDKAQKDVEGLRSSVKKFFEDMRKSDEEAGKAIAASAGGALSALGGITGGLGTAYGASGGGFQQLQTQLGRNVAGAAGGVGKGIGGALGAAGGPLGSAAGAAAGGFIGEAIGGAINREIDAVEIPRQAAKSRIAQLNGVAAMFGIGGGQGFSDQALQRALNFSEAFEKRRFLGERKVLEMQVWR